MVLVVALCAAKAGVGVLSSMGDSLKVAAQALGRWGGVCMRGVCVQAVGRMRAKPDRAYGGVQVVVLPGHAAGVHVGALKLAIHAIHIECPPVCARQAPPQAKAAARCACMRSR
jgi:hypothetical protein